ncbi:MAG: pyridoxine 5'-phosphate synthase, partial [Myxococcota bacterium]
GLDLRLPAVVDAVGRLAQAELPVRLFIDPDEAMIRRAAELGVRTVELHTGDFANAMPAAMPSELARLSAGARLGAELDLRVAAGHGLTVENTPRLLAAAPEVEEVNIGHALVSDAVFTGLERAVRAFLAVLK